MQYDSRLTDQVVGNIGLKSFIIIENDRPEFSSNFYENSILTESFRVVLRGLQNAPGTQYETIPGIQQETGYIEAYRGV